MRNGMVHITSHFTAGGRPSFNVVRVHHYATSVIMQEIQGARPGDCRLTVLVGCDSILFEHVAGPNKGRTFIFTPYDGDENGWNEMIAFVMSVKNIWNAGYHVSTVA